MGLGNSDPFNRTLSVEKPYSIGVIGGGQLGKMFAAEAKRMSLKVVVLDPSPLCPASAFADELILADFKDESAIESISHKCDVITFEIELANSTALKQLEERHFPVRPAPAALSIIQNKFRQKTFLKNNGLPVADFELVKSVAQARAFCDTHGFPAMLKACEDSYDGRGNFVLRSLRDIKDGLDYFSGRQCMLEKFINFTKEVSVMVARNPDGQIECFPLVENIHRNNILDTTIAPARVSNSIKKKALRIAHDVVDAFSSAGIFGVEMFVDNGGKLLINEIAPRPHNSGHYSNEACSISQFEQHLRCVLNLPLIKPELLSPAAMINILGPVGIDGPYDIEGLSQALSVPGVALYIYGKNSSRPNRKLGHITATGATTRLAFDRARKARSMLKIVDATVRKT